MCFRHTILLYLTKKQGFNLAVGVKGVQTYNIATGTITYAIKGRDILREKGYKARIERRNSDLGTLGCGYSIIATGDIRKMESLLKSSGIKILTVTVE